MARRRISADRCWAYVTKNVEFTYSVAGGTMGTTEPLIAFDDIEPDEAMLTRERSEFYFERLIIWWRPYFLRTSLLAIPEPMSVHRLGVLGDTVEMGIQEAPEASANFFNRVLQEEVIWNYEVRANDWDGGAVSVSTEATADFQGYPRPREVHKWDLSSKFRLGEDTSLVWQIASGPDYGASSDIHIFGCDLTVKALLRRGK